MALQILELTTGDTNYIAKHNANNDVLKNAVQTLQTQVGSGPTAAINFPIYAQTVTGSGSGRLTDTELVASDAGGGTLSISSGTAWVGAAAAMRGAGAVVLDFSSQPSDTYYTHLDATGAWSFDTSPGEAIHTVVWSGSSFTTITQPAIIWSSTAYQAALYSATYDQTFSNLGDRLDNVEVQLVVDAFADLSDTPADFTGQTGKLVAVNGTEDGLEFIDAAAPGASDFTGLTDTPANLTGQGEKLVAVNVGETALEFIDAPSGGASDFAGLTDTPASYSGQAGKVATVNNAEDGIEFVAEPYDVGGTYPGAPAASVVMLRYPFPRAATFPAGLTDSQGVAGTAATAQTDFDIQKDGVSVGTMRFAAAATTATFIMASATSFAVGDVMTIVAPGTPDSTLADIGFALTGER